MNTPATLTHSQRMSLLADRLMGHAAKLTPSDKAAADDCVAAAQLLDAIVRMDPQGLTQHDVCAYSVVHPQRSGTALFVDQGRAAAYSVRLPGGYLKHLVSFDDAQAAVAQAILHTRAQYREAEAA